MLKIEVHIYYDPFLEENRIISNVNFKLIGSLIVLTCVPYFHLSLTKRLHITWKAYVHEL